MLQLRLRLTFSNNETKRREDFFPSHFDRKTHNHTLSLTLTLSLSLLLSHSHTLLLLDIFAWNLSFFKFLIFSKLFILKFFNNQFWKVFKFFNRKLFGIHTHSLALEQEDVKLYLRMKWNSTSNSTLYTFTCGQSYKQFTIVIYDSRVIIWGIFKSGTTRES